LFELKTGNKQFSMIIEDDGQGTEKVNKERGLGLRGIEGRVELFNGTMAVYSEKGKGFKLEIKIPLA
jgi:signal transduction histidine kinase